MQRIQTATSGENGIRQHFTFLKIFSARRIHAFPSLLMMITLRACSLSEILPVCTSYSCPSKQCHVMLASRLLTYALLHPGSQLFSHLPASLTILTGSILTNDLIGTSRMKARWSPMLYPNSIMHVLLMSKLLDTHSPLIGLDPLKNVAPRLFPVC
jgi:hypothetical protein